jgi:4-hydroxythreonine-4-phosphate dehydrogenase
MLKHNITHKPIIGITIGDAAGIGPEVIVKALRTPGVYDVCRPMVIGDRRVFDDPRLAARFDGFQLVQSEADIAVIAEGQPALLDMANLAPDEIELRCVAAATGKAAVEYVIKATRLALAGAIDGIATAPLNKAAMHKAGFDYIGHTEILADVTQTPQCTTMLATTGLRVTHVTRHLPFKEIANHLNHDNILETIRITHSGMQMLGYARPRLAVAGLNPHNGDDGLMGREEIELIAPAVKIAQMEGMEVRGPIPADSVFFAAIRGDYDVVVCMYHDQGHIAVKTHGFEKSITITLGIPIIRTSADHGTAFDIAGSGIAHCDSMLTAILEAARMAELR